MSPEQVLIDWGLAALAGAVILFLAAGGYWMFYPVVTFISGIYQSLIGEVLFQAFKIRPDRQRRKNHAFEHAIHNLLAEATGRRVGMRSHTDRIIFNTNIPETTVREKIDEAMDRLQDGETDLAFTPLCGDYHRFPRVFTAWAIVFAIMTYGVNFWWIAFAALAGNWLGTWIVPQAQLLSDLDPDVSDLRIANVIVHPAPTTSRFHKTPGLRYQIVTEREMSAV